MFAYLKAFVMAFAVLTAACSLGLGETITIIDDFSDGATLSPYWTGGWEPPYNVTEEDVGLLSAIGGVRRVEFDSDGGRGWVNSAPYLGQARVQQGFNWATMVLSYGNKTTAGSELNLNWSSGGTLTIDVAEFRPNLRSFAFMVTVNSGGTDYAYQGGAGGTLKIPLAEFPGLRLSDIDGLRFGFGVGGPNAVTMELAIRSIYTDAIPEPSTSALLAAAGLCVLGYISRQARRPR